MRRKLRFSPRGAVTEMFFYQSLARHLGVAFIAGDIALGAGARYPHSIHAGVAPLASGAGWLAAPQGSTLTSLLRRKQRGERLEGNGRFFRANHRANHSL